MKGCFPFSENGFWHSGLHLYRREDASFYAFLPGKCVYIRRNQEKAYPDMNPPERISGSELLINDCEIILQEKAQTDDNVYYCFTDLSEEEKREVFDKLELSADASCVILQHEIKSNDNVFSFFTLYMHLRNIPEIEKEDYLLPSDILGEYGDSQGECGIVHAEIFTNKELDELIPKSLENDPSQDYREFGGNQTQYLVSSMEGKSVFLPKGSILEILKLPTEEYPRSLQVQIKQIAVEITDTNDAGRNSAAEAAADAVVSPESADLVTEEKKIGVTVRYKINGQESSVPVLVLKEKIKCPEGLLREYLGENRCLVQFDCIQSVVCEELRDTFWITTDSCQVKQWKEIKQDEEQEPRSTVIVRNINNNYDGKLVGLTIYSEAPDKKYINGKSQEKICGKRFYRSEFQKVIAVDTSGEEKALYRIVDDDAEIYVDRSENYANAWTDLKSNTITFTSAETAETNVLFTETSFLQKVYAMCSRYLQGTDAANTIESFYELNKDFFYKCGFQIDSDWVKKEKNCGIKFFSFFVNLWNRIQIWNEDRKNEQLPDNLKDSFDFIFYNHNYFLEHIKQIHRGYAAKLRQVQDIVMAEWQMFQGNRGIYNNFDSDEQTFCNQAVYMTIQAVDINYCSAFLMGADEPPWRVELKEYKPLGLNEHYEYKSSNLWCDVLEYQSNHTADTGILKITKKQAFYMAQLGYVVIAAWKNKSQNGSPHFVTVRPCAGEFPGEDDLPVAHVGAGRNEEKRLQDAFSGQGNEDKKYKEVLFYCNINQNFGLEKYEKENR